MSEIRGHLKQLVEQTALRLPSVTHRKMFGCDAWFSRGQIFSLIWKTGRVGVRLPEQAAFDDALALEGAEPWSVAAKMKPVAHWVLLPEGFNDDEEQVEPWVKRAHGLAARKVAVKTAAQALAWVKQHQVVTLAGRLARVPCFVEAVVGAPAAKAKLIDALAEGLEDSSQVVSLKLLEGKATFVDRALWPALLAVVLDEGWRRARVKALSAAAKALLKKVEAAACVRGDAPKPVKELEEALLVHCGSDHTVNGRHEKRLTGWPQWAKAQGARAGRLTVEAALTQLQAAAGGHRTGLH